MNPSPRPTSLRLSLTFSLIALVILVAFWGMPTLAAPSGPRGGDPTLGSELYVEGITFPVAMAFAPDGHLFVTEKVLDEAPTPMGTIRVVRPDATLQTTPFVTLTLSNASRYHEKGLLGIALDPDFEKNAYLYTYRTVAPDEENPNEHGELLRFTAVLSGTNWVGEEMVTVIDDLPVAPDCCHNGGILHFGPDGKLYLPIGDNGTPSNAQNLSTRTGKILRFNPDGTIPDDNPFVDTPEADPAVYAYGFRNVFDFDWHPVTGELYATENGPGCNDELNRVVPGGNYGWPYSSTSYATCVDPGPSYIDPLWAVSPPIGITGAAFYTGTIPALQDRLFIGGWGNGEINGRLYQMTLTEGGDIESTELLFDDCGDPSAGWYMADVISGPDGNLYFACHPHAPANSSEQGAIFRLTVSASPTTPPALYLPLVSR